MDFKNLINNSSLTYSYENKHISLIEWQDNCKKLIYKLLDIRRFDLSSLAISTTETEFDCYIEEKISINFSESLSWEAILLKPKGINPPYKLVIALHDHGGFYYYGKERFIEHIDNRFLQEYRQKYYSNKAWVMELLKNGFAAFCPDAFYFGSMKLTLDTIKKWVDEQTYKNLINNQDNLYEYIKEYNKICSQLEGLTFKNINFMGWLFAGVMVSGDLMWLDYISKHPEINSNNISCMGFSLGGFRTLMLSALSPLIKKSVITCFMCELRYMLGKTANHTFMVHVPYLAKYIDLPDIAGLIAPRKLFVQCCTYDTLFDYEGMKNACKKITMIYKEADAENNINYNFYDNPHEFNAIMLDDAIIFLK